MVTAPKPGTPEWMAMVTASKVAAILGLSPWESQYSMWHQMSGNIPGAQENRHMERGNRLETAVLDWWLADNPDQTEVDRQRWYPLGDWAGATPDMDVTAPNGDHELVDAKTISTDDAWTDEPPVHYLASSMWQLACAPTAKRVHLAVLFGRPFDLRHYVIERDDALIGQIVNQARAFYDTLHMGVEPDLDDTVATFEAVKAQHPDIDAEMDVEVPRELAHEYVTASIAKKDAEAAERAAKTRLLDAMGKARVATCGGAKVARRQAGQHGVSLVRIAKTITAPERTEAS